MDKPQWKLVPVEPNREMIDAYLGMNGRFQSARSDWAAMLAAAPTPAVSGIEITLKRTLGATGVAFDPPGPRRAYTYQHQPGNIEAWRMGEACRKAAYSPGGDPIDGGLSMLKELQAIGYGVFAIEPSPLTGVTAASLGIDAPLEPHPPTRDCMCAECRPSFEDAPEQPSRLIASREQISPSGTVLHLTEEGLASITSSATSIPGVATSPVIDIADVRQYLEAWGCMAHPGVAALVNWYATHPAAQQGGGNG